MATATLAVSSSAVNPKHESVEEYLVWHRQHHARQDWLSRSEGEVLWRLDGRQMRAAELAEATQQSLTAMVYLLCRMRKRSLVYQPAQGHWTARPELSREVRP